MSQSPAESPPRVLVVDDNPAIHDDFRKILGAKSESQSRLDNIEAELFGQAGRGRDRAGFRLDSALQGQEALALVQKAVQENDPYVLAFVDVRMPPGWDGVETLERIWQCAPELQAVICTAYSDYSWDDMTRRLGHTDNLLILKKPFETVEVLQLAHALTQKWALARQAKLRVEDLDRMVRLRTEELRGSEERFSKAFHCSPNPAAILSGAERKFLGANQSFVDLSGYPPEQLMQRTDRDLQLWAKNSDSNAAAALPDGRLRNQAFLLRRSDGTTRQILLSIEPITLGTTPCLLVNAEDITDQLKLEAQLRQAQKMEVIGRMAAGIAHEFNNVLTVIQGDVGLLLTAGASNMLDRTALLNQIMQASQRAASFTKQLLAFSRKQVLQPRPLNLSATVQNTKKMLSRLIGEKFEVRLQCPNELPSVMADEGGVEQILINLALNARDAMPNGGLIDISTELVVLDAASVAANAEARAGRFVCLDHHRSWLRDGYPDSGAHFRSLLHDQGCGQGDRSRVVDHSRHREAARRLGERDQSRWDAGQRSKYFFPPWMRPRLPRLARKRLMRPRQNPATARRSWLWRTKRRCANWPARRCRNAATKCSRPRTARRRSSSGSTARSRSVFCSPTW